MTLTWAEEMLTLNELELNLVPGIGGRLMDIVYKGESLLFQNPDLLNHQADLAKLDQLPSRATHIPFPLWGGEKTWIAPESEWPNGAPFAMLDSGPYELIHKDARCATMLSRLCPQSGLQIRRTITLTGNDSWTVRHKVTNHGSLPRPTGLWSVIMTQNPANYLFRTQPEEPVKTVFGDPGNALSITAGIGQIRCDTRREFKLSTHPTNRVAAARFVTPSGSIWLISRIDTLEIKSNYAHGQALEFYNSGHYDYGELEWHSTLVNLLPGQSHSFELTYQVMLETPGQNPSDVFEMIDIEQEHLQ